jgi:hypothetical protein
MSPIPHSMILPTVPRMARLPDVAAAPTDQISSPKVRLQGFSSNLRCATGGAATGRSPYTIHNAGDFLAGAVVGWAVGGTVAKLFGLGC